MLTTLLKIGRVLLTGRNMSAVNFVNLEDGSDDRETVNGLPLFLEQMTLGHCS
jgi:hypothetical protein